MRACVSNMCLVVAEPGQDGGDRLESGEPPRPLLLVAGGPRPERLPSEALQHTFPHSRFAASTAASLSYQQH